MSKFAKHPRIAVDLNLDGFVARKRLLAEFEGVLEKDREMRREGWMPLLYRFEGSYLVKMLIVFVLHGGMLIRMLECFFAQMYRGHANYSEEMGDVQVSLLDISPCDPFNVQC